MLMIGLESSSGFSELKSGEELKKVIIFNCQDKDFDGEDRRYHPIN